MESLRDFKAKLRTTPIKRTLSQHGDTTSKISKNVKNQLRSMQSKRQLELPKSKKKAGTSQFASNLMNALGGQPTQKRVQAGAGRPKAVFKNPYGVPAQQYYKILRHQKMEAKIQAERQQVQLQRNLAQRGIPPERVQQIIEQRSMPIQQQQVQQQVPMQRPVQQIPQQMQPVRGERRVWFDRSYLQTETDVWGNQKIVKRGAESSFFN